jgi:hypothetical protein
VLFPSLFELRRRGLNYSPVAWSTAQLALFVKHMPNWPGLCSGSLADCDTPKLIHLTRTVTRLKSSDEPS